MKLKIFSFIYLMLSLTCMSNPINSMLSYKSSAFDNEQQKYIPVKYITRVSGNVWFPTGVYNVSKWQLSTIGYFPYNSGYCIVFGAYYSNNNWTGYGFAWNYTLSSRPVHGNKYGGFWYKPDKMFDYAADHPILCIVNETKCTITWSNYGTNSAESSQGLNGEQIYLLGNGHRTIATGFGLGETIIWQNDVIVAHFVPCIRAIDKTPIFYDDINDIEVENEGDGVVGFIEF